MGYFKGKKHKYETDLNNSRSFTRATQTVW